MDQVKIGKFIAELRRRAGLTQEALGKKIGVTNKTISRWENGDYMPNIEMLQLLAEEFSISISEILAGEKFSDEETKAEDPVQTEEISVDEEITAETDADGFRAVEETDEVPFDEDDEISFDAEEEEETPEETAEEVLEDMAHEEDAEDEVKWAEKVICNFGVYAGTPLGEMMQDARGYQTIKWLVQRYKGQNQEIQKAAKILLDHEKEMQKAA